MEQIVNESTPLAVYAVALHRAQAVVLSNNFGEEIFQGHPLTILG